MQGNNNKLTDFACKRMAVYYYFLIVRSTMTDPKRMRRGGRTTQNVLTHPKGRWHYSESVDPPGGEVALLRRCKK